MRTILESLALKYRFVFEQLREISPHPIDKLFIIGGGAKNHLLCQFAADATGLTVISGPSEATATGNILYQAKTCGFIRSIQELREVVRNSIPQETFTPREISTWNKAYSRFLEMLNKKVNP